MELTTLLSTTATASAALVAIVGALLVARVVSLASERSGLTHQRDDLRARLGHERALFADLDQRLLAEDAAELIDETYEQLVRSRREPDIEDLLRGADIERTADEVKPAVHAELERIQTAREDLEPLFAQGLPSAHVDELEELGLINVPDDHERAYEEVFWSLVTQQPGADPADPHYAMFERERQMSVYALSRTPHDAAEHARLRRDTEEARHRVAALSTQLAQLEFALERVSHPAGINVGAAVLGSFALLGTVVPLGGLALLSMGIDLPPWTAWYTVTIFGVGVAALVAYVIGTVRRLSSGQL